MKRVTLALSIAVFCLFSLFSATAQAQVRQSPVTVTISPTLVSQEYSVGTTRVALGMFNVQAKDLDAQVTALAFKRIGSSKNPLSNPRVAIGATEFELEQHAGGYSVVNRKGLVVIGARSMAMVMVFADIPANTTDQDIGIEFTSITANDCVRKLDLSGPLHKIVGQMDAGIANPGHVFVTAYAGGPPVTAFTMMSTGARSFWLPDNNLLPTIPPINFIERSGGMVPGQGTDIHLQVGANVTPGTYEGTGHISNFDGPDPRPVIDFQITITVLAMPPPPPPPPCNECEANPFAVKLVSIPQGIQPPVIFDKPVVDQVNVRVILRSSVL